MPLLEQSVAQLSEQVSEQLDHRPSDQLSHPLAGQTADQAADTAIPPRSTAPGPQDRLAAELQKRLIALPLRAPVAARLRSVARAVLPTSLRTGLRRLLLTVLYILATVQFVGAYLYLEWPYLNIDLWERGYAPLPFQTRLLLAPLYRWFDHLPWSVGYASRLARNHYFFPHGVSPSMVLEFYLGIACMLFSGWVAHAIYSAATRRNLLRPLVYPLFLGLCTLVYIVHTVQNFRYVYDLPSLAAYAAGFYLIYFRKPVAWFVLLFAVATLNRETTLLLLPFWALSQALGPDGRLRWRTLLSGRVLVVVLPLLAYWALWHHVVFSIFSTNASEYYPRLLFNLRCFLRLRYWPQLAGAFGFLWPVLIVYRRQLRDAQLRAWLLVLPVWYGFMLLWAILTETRVFGELMPFLAPVAAILGEEVFAAKVLRAQAQEARRDTPREAGLLATHKAGRAA